MSNLTRRAVRRGFSIAATAAAVTTIPSWSRQQIPTDLDALLLQLEPERPR